MNRDPRDYPDSVKECWAVHQVLRVLGFSPDDIYVTTGKNAENSFGFFVVLRTQERDFTVTVGTYDSCTDVANDLKMWTDFAKQSNDAVFDKTIMEQIYLESFVKTNQHQFVFGLMSKGFYFPVTTN